LKVTWQYDRKDVSVCKKDVAMCVQVCGCAGDGVTEGVAICVQVCGCAGDGVTEGVAICVRVCWRRSDRGRSYLCTGVRVCWRRSDRARLRMPQTLSSIISEQLLLMTSAMMVLKDKCSRQLRVAWVRKYLRRGVCSYRSETTKAKLPEHWRICLRKEKQNSGVLDGSSIRLYTEVQSGW